MFRLHTAVCARPLVALHSFRKVRRPQGSWLGSLTWRDSTACYSCSGHIFRSGAERKPGVLPPNIFLFIYYTQESFAIMKSRAALFIITVKED